MAALSIFCQFRLDVYKDTYLLLVKAYRRVVRGLCNEMKMDAAERLVLEMEKHGRIAHDVCVYSEIIQGHRKDMNLHRALRFFLDEVAPRRRKINRVIASSILQCLCLMGMFSEAYHLFMEFREKKVSLDRFCYNVAFDALVKLGKVEDAIKLFREMTGEQGIAPFVVNYTTLIGGCCLQGKIHDAHDLMIEMEETGKTPDTVIYNVLAGGLARNKRAQEALGTLKIMEGRGVKPTSVTHNMVIEGLIVGGKTDVAEAFYESLGHDKSRENEASMIIPDLYTYTAMINAYCRKDELKEAYALFQEMKQRRIFPDVVTYTVLLHHNPELDVKREMKALGIKRDLHYYTVLIDRQCKTGELEDAERIFCEMIESGVEPDAAPYTALIARCCRDGSIRNADIVLEEMLEKGIEP
ncbi:hypothetical protein EUTSA_v10009488mg, partial [Eutrema salsugineum]